MSAPAQNGRSPLPLEENPLRERRVVLRRYLRNAVIGALLALMAYHIFVIETDWARIGGPGDVLRTTAEFLPDLSFVPAILDPLLETLLIAFWGTVLATAVAMPVAYIAARNVTPVYPLTYTIGRAIIVLSRSVHELIFALIFVSALGLGPLPGILALGIRSIGFLAKTTSEAIENVDRRPIEAMEATGANAFSVFLFGNFPQIFPVVVGNVIFQLDINLRRASILGMVGAGGIGYVFAEQMQAYNWNNAGTVVLGIAVMVIAGEFISNRIRTRLIGGAGAERMGGE
ncbi:MAG: phosphonate ABC transporter, permease protein PhnE [Gammaproteobacteria bacterium]|nr:phosphonate ABC transporter, permease protein PhnE [Gammaproteobacteria bacterium]